MGSLKVDVANAFNTLGLQAVLSNAATSASAMYPGLRFPYEEPVQLFCQGDLLWTKTVVPTRAGHVSYRRPTHGSCHAGVWSNMVCLLPG